jgi:hemin uptake protein HemP
MSSVGNASTTSSPSPAGPTKGPQQVDVQQLLAGAQEVRLVHHGVEYRLRVTRQGKLILTK